MLAPGDHSAASISVAARMGRILLIMGGIAVAVVVAVSTGAITLPGAQDGTRTTPASAQASLAANEQWASAMCTNVLAWKNEVQHDGTSLNLGFGPLARIQDAIAATTRMLNEVNRLGLPPAAQTAQARAEIDRLRSDLESRLQNVEGVAGSVASGNVAAIGTLLGDLENDGALGAQIAGELRRVVSVDLGLSLVETRACRQLVGIPI
jgi:hypothetical protein